MRTRGRVDGNQAQVVQALRKAGVAVLSLAPMGNGCPDLLASLRGYTCLVEVKDGAKPPSERKLTAMEQAFVDSWPGDVFVVTDPMEAVLKVIEGARPR